MCHTDTQYFKVPEKNVELTVYRRWLNSHSIFFLHPLLEVATPPLDLPWNLGECHEMFGVASYQWDRKILICHDLAEFHPAPPPSPILLGDAKPLSTFLGTSASALESFITLAIIGAEKSRYVVIWVKSHPAPSPPLDDHANPLSTFLGTLAIVLKSFMTLAIIGAEKPQYVVIWVKSHPASPHPPMTIPTPRRPSLGPREALWKVW
jgi:hypothetical protein